MATLTEIVWAQQPDYVRSGDDGTGYALIQSVCQQADLVVELLGDPETWMDPTVTPASQLPWVAALAGIDLTAVPNADRRGFVDSETSRYRGSIPAITQRVGLTLTGSKSVQIECPYSGDELAILVRTFTPETPDAAATEAAIRAEVPAWLELTVDVADGVDYDAINTLYTDYDDMTTNGGTYNDLSNTQP